MRVFETKLLSALAIVFYLAMMANAAVGWDGLCPPNTHWDGSMLSPKNVCHLPWEATPP